MTTATELRARAATMLRAAALVAAGAVCGAVGGAYTVLAHGDALGARLIAAGAHLTNAGTEPVWRVELANAVSTGDAPAIDDLPDTAPAKLAAAKRRK